MTKHDNADGRYPLYPKAKKSTKWWVASAKTEEEIEHGAYDGMNCRSRQHAMTVMHRLVAGGEAIVAYAVKHRRSVAKSSIDGIRLGDGLGCRTWTPHGTLDFIPN